MPFQKEPRLIQHIASYKKTKLKLDGEIKF